MTIEKLNTITPDLTTQNIARIAELFPECVTEGPAGTASDRGEPVIDFDLLRQALADHIVEGPQERYRLDWPGKRQALLTANLPVDKTLRPMRGESVDFDATRNLFIEGDNLDALKLLQETYLGKVKMIYIDPPYNTGNDFVYKDNFAQSREEYETDSGQRDDAGGRLVANPESNGRYHSNWLSMLYPRLKLARQLLQDDGAIAISIDDIEFANLRKVAAEVFGESSLVGVIIWKSRQIIDSRNKNKMSTDHEYICVIAKDAERFSLLGKEIDEGKYSNPDNDPRGPWMSNNILGLANASQRPNLHFDLVDPATGRAFPCPADSGWRYSKLTMAEKIAEGRIVFPNRDEGRPREKIYLNELKDAFTGFSSVLGEEACYTLHGSREAKALMGNKYFDFPKPTGLLEILIRQIAPDPDSVVMDFFAGSGSTAEAVLKVNASDNGRRAYFCVQIDEPTSEDSVEAQDGYRTIAELSRERIRRAGKKILEENPDLKHTLDVGFRAFRIDRGNFADTRVTPQQASQAALAGMISHIKDGRGDEDLLFGTLLRWGVDITLPIDKREVAGRTIWLVDPPADSEQGAALIACFARPHQGKGGIDTELADAIARMKPLRALFRDDGFVSDAIMENVQSRFKQLAPDTDVKVL